MAEAVETQQIPVQTDKVHDYPRPKGRPSWARTAPSDWTPKQREAAEAFWSVNVKHLGIPLTTYGFILAGGRRKTQTPEERRAKDSQRQRERRALLKAGAAVAAGDAETTGNPQPGEESPSAAQSAPPTEATGTRRKIALTREEKLARDAERQRDRRRQANQKKASTQVPEAREQASLAPLAAPVAPPVPPSVSVSDTSTAVAPARPSVKSGSVELVLTVGEAEYELLRRVALARSFDGPDSTAVTVVKGLVERGIPELRTELRSRLAAIAEMPD